MNRPFHSPDHDHARCESDAMQAAEAQCQRQGARLTPLRRQVLETLVSGHKALGAYDIMDRLAEHGPRPAPITVYRALDFLLEHGLVHRLASRNAFLACIHNHTLGEGVVFLICEQCGEVGEVSSAGVRDALRNTAGTAGFRPNLPVIEVPGLCSRCASAGAPDRL